MTTNTFHANIKKFISLFILIFFSFSVFSQTGIFQPVSSSYIGDNGTSGAVKGSKIQSDGTVVLAVNITDASYGGISATLLNGATSSSAGAVVRLNAAGNAVLSVTKIGAEVLDLSIDGNDNIYVAIGNGGLVKLNSTATSLIYQKANGGYCKRLDAGANGAVVALNGTGENTGTIYLYNTAGSELYNSPGKSFTEDVAINESLGLIYYLGFRNTSTGCNPVQVCYVIAKNFSNTEVWRNYDWAANLLDDCDGTPRENNMADTRGYRIAMGDDGNLYAAFETAGGNHIFRYDPKDLSKTVTIVGGDSYHAFYNSRDEHKTVFCRFNAANGNCLLGQQLCARPSGINGPADALRIKDGDISADADGRVYLVGGSSNGLPLTFDVPEAGTGTGGPFLIIMSPNFATRELVTRLGSGEVYSVNVRKIGGTAKVVYGGFEANKSLYLRNPIQATSASGSKNGCFATLSFFAGKQAPSTTITAPANLATFFSGTPITINADASDDGSISKVEFFRDNVLLSSSTTTPYSYTWTDAPNGSFILRTKAYDNEGFEGISTRKQINVTVPAENLALNKSVTYSSQQTGNEARKAVDGLVDTRWSATPYPQWMEVDLGQVYNINRTELVAQYDRAYKFKVEAKANSGDAYTLVVDRTYNTEGASASVPNANDFANTPARYVKLTVTGNNGASSWASIVEFRVFSVQIATTQVTGVTVSPTAAKLAVSATQQLTATVSPANATNKAVSWTTSNASIVTVSSSGLVTAIAAGTATITVTTQDGSFTATCTITVIVPVTGVSVSPASQTLAIGATQQLTASITPSNATNKTVSWSTSNASVATVSTAGLVTAVAAGTATITVTTQEGGFTATCAITVNAVSAGDGLKADYFNTRDLSGTVAVSRIDQTINFDWGNGTYATSQNTDNFSARWTGQVKPLYSETYTFETESDDGIRLWVNGQQLVNKWVDQGPTKWSGTISLTAGQKYDIKMEYYENGGGAVARLRWSSASQAYAIIPQAQLYSTSTVVAVTGVTVSPTSATITAGATQQLTATVAPANATNKTVSWTTSNASVATVSSTGLVTAVAAGSATITVTTQDGGFIATSAITVNAPVAGSVVYAINAGGAAFTATDGTVYEADRYFSGGSTYTTGTTTIANTDDDLLYRSERYGNISYELPVTNGNYTVTLKFAEIYMNGTGKRQFDVAIEGLQSISNLDIFASAGGNYTAYDVIRDVTVSDGKLNIVFTTDIDNAKVSAILVKEPAQLKSASIATEVASINNIKFKAHPNPASDYLTIEGESTDETAVYVVDNFGRIVSTYKYNGKFSSNLDISALPAGMYYVKAVSGSFTDVEKIIIK